MPVPIKYNVRHVVRRWRTTALTIVAIGLVVGMFVCVQSLAAGVELALKDAGDPLNVIVLRKAAQAESSSSVDRESAPIIAFIDGPAQSADGKPLVDAQSVGIVNRPRAAPAEGNTNVVIRGVGPMAMQVHPEIELVEGRMFTPGLNELVVGSSAAKRFANVQVGEELKLVRSTWKVVGRFDAQGSAYDSELWGDVNRVNPEFDRTVYSSVTIRAADEAGVETILANIEGNKQVSNLEAKRERAYYAKQSESSFFLKFLGSFLAVVMSVGAIFAAMNTMYASIGGRSAEIATLRVLGFSRRSILLSFVLESMFIAALGGVLGGLMALPMNGYATGTAMGMMNFSELAFAFRVTPGLIVTGVVFAMFIGLIGGFLPSLQASRRQIVSGLRDA